MRYRLATILVVLDNVDQIHRLEQTLTSEGYSTTSTPCTNINLEIVKNTRPDLIILDVVSKDFDGIKFCQAIQEEYKTDNPLILFLSNEKADFIEIAALDAGGDDFIHQPYEGNVLISRIRALLRRKYREYVENQILDFGELRIDLSRMEITIHNVSKELLKKEFEILNILTSRPGKVFTREEIFHRVWNSNPKIGDRTIDVHISKLREKLGVDYIRTIKGIGYKFEPI